MFAFPSEVVKYQYFIKSKQNSHPVGFLYFSQKPSFGIDFIARFIKQWLQNTKKFLINTVFLCLLAVT